MQKPTKKQLTDAVTYLTTELQKVLDLHSSGTSVDFPAYLAEVLVNTPSLEPQPKAVAEVVEESADVVDSEAPAVA